MNWNDKIAIKRKLEFQIKADDSDSASGNVFLMPQMKLIAVSLS